MADARQVLEESRSKQQEVVELRRDIHRHPELGLEEHRTAELVASRLEELGLEVRRGVGGTGVVGLLRGGGGEGKVIALRADMDALPIDEARSDHQYASTAAGKMHACGHDAHTAILLGTAALLASHRQELRGAVKFLFQPAEEGPGGAEPMIADGALENPRPDAVLGLHVHPELDSGLVGYTPGAMTAATDEIQITIKGQGGHGAYPHRSVDAIAVAAQVVTALQTVVSRNIDPTQPAVVTIGKISGGFRHNIIAPSVEMEGTVRSQDPAVREQLPGLIERVVAGVTSAMGAEYTMSYNFGYPPLVNDDELLQFVKASAAEVLGEDHVLSFGGTMGGEDFSYFAQEVPGVFLRLGTGSEEKDTCYPCHHPNFDIDEDALPVGVAVLAHTARRFLEDA